MTWSQYFQGAGGGGEEMVQDEMMARQDISSIAGQDELLMDVIWLAPHTLTHQHQHTGTEKLEGMSGNGSWTRGPEEASITATGTSNSALLNRVNLDGLCCILKYLRPSLSSVSLSSVSLCLLCLCLCLCSSSSNASSPTPQILTDTDTCTHASLHTHTHTHTHTRTHTQRHC